MIRYTENTRRLLWLGLISGLILIIRGFIEIDVIGIVGGMTLVLLTWLHWEAVGGKDDGKK